MKNQDIKVPFFSVGGFQFFAKHRLCLAGVSLAMLYLTVLGFDSITISFCKASGVDESLVSIMRKNPKLKLATNRLVFSWEFLLCLVFWAASPFPSCEQNSEPLSRH